MVGLYRKGLPPVTGGVLDQSAWFIGAAEFIWGEESYWKRRLGPLVSMDDE